jgi:glycosyltransferase involved in cell wall biosynthesis
MHKKISIITPCYNEEDGLYECINSIKKLFESELKNYDYEHIICDNNSNKKTISIIREISQKDKKVKVILNAKNYGSVKSTFNGIKNSSGDAVLLFFPVDMQDPPEQIPELVKKWESGFDFVVGCRDQRQEFFIMKSVRKFFYIILKKFSKNEIPHNVSDFQLVDRKIVNRFLKLKDNSPFIRTLAFEFSDNFDTINYTWRKRAFGKSKEPLRDYISTAMNGLISVSDIPFRLILILGFVVSFLSISYGVFAIFYNLLTESGLEKGIPTLLVSVLIFSGIQLLVLGFLGEYITSIYDQIKKDIGINEKEKINF